MEDFFTSNYNRLDVATVYPAFLLLLLAVCDVAPESTSLAANCLLTLRVWWITRNGKLVCLLIARVSPIMLYISSFILIVMYMFAVLGMEVFGPYEHSKSLTLPPSHPHPHPTHNHVHNHVHTHTHAHAHTHRSLHPSHTRSHTHTHVCATAP